MFILFNFMGINLFCLLFYLSYSEKKVLSSVYIIITFLDNKYFVKKLYRRVDGKRNVIKPILHFF